MLCYLLFVGCALRLLLFWTSFASCSLLVVMLTRFVICVLIVYGLLIAAVGVHCVDHWGSCVVCCV